MFRRFHGCSEQRKGQLQTLRYSITNEGREKAPRPSVEEEGKGDIQAVKNILMNRLGGILA
jgi:hypothetical protein